MKKSKTKKIVKIIITQLFAILLLIFLLLPIYQMLITALRPADLPWPSPAKLYPDNITFKNFITAFKIVPRLPQYLLNSFIYGFGVSIISILIALPAGYAIARFKKFKLRKPITIFVIYANMFAPIMLLIPIYVIMNLLGLINTYFSVILAGSIFTIPLSTWLITSYIQTIPEQIEEAALIDGCSVYKLIPKIVFPMIAPAIVSVFIYSFITGWSQQFLLSMVLIKNDKLMPITQGLYQFFSRSSVRWNELMAAILVSTLIPVSLFMIFQKYIVKGMTTGALKE